MWPKVGIKNSTNVSKGCLKGDTTVFASKWCLYNSPKATKHFGLHLQEFVFKSLSLVTLDQPAPTSRRRERLKNSTSKKLNRSSRSISLKLFARSIGRWCGPTSVWPDWAKFHHFGYFLSLWQLFWWYFYPVFGNYWTRFGIFGFFLWLLVDQIM